jgi:putative ABC transport system permease protein
MRQIRFMRNIRLGVKNLLLHKLRSLLTVLGIVFGVGSVIAMLSVGEGASQQALEEIRKLGSNNIIIKAIKPIDEEAMSARGAFMSIYGLLYEDEARIRQAVDSVQRTAPAKLIRKDGQLGERTMELRLVGTTADWFVLVDRLVLAGRTFNEDDMADNAAVCVLTEEGARRLLATEHSIGQSIAIGPDSYEVLGIIRSEQAGGGSIQTPDEQVDAYVPLNVVRERYGDLFVRQTAGSQDRELVELNQIIVQVASTDQVEAAASAITAMLKRFHTKTDYMITVPLSLLRQAEATKRMFNIVLGSIAGISLLVGGIGIMNIMLASVTERTREIGIRRAIGAKRRQIIAQFLVETIVLSSIGGLIGTGIGLLLPWVITYLAAMPTVVPLYSIVLSLGISVGVGILFGLYPAIRAARLDPIEALRHE